MLLIQRLTALICIAVLALGLAACSDSPRQDLRFALSSAPITLDPRFATDAASARINRLLYQSLVDFDASFRPIPALAEWQQIQPTQYRFTIHADAVFHDGKPLTALDIKATYDSILDPATASPHRAGFAMIERIEAPDTRTVTFTLNMPDPLFPGRLVIGILPANKLQQGHGFNRQPIGSGTFRFVDWPSEGVLNLERVADQQAFQFVEVKNPTVRVLKLLRGEVDMLQNDLPTELVSYLEEQNTVQVMHGQGSNFTYLGFNFADETTAELTLRQAVAHAIDRPAIIKYVLGNGATPASALLPPDHWAGNPELPLLEYDPQRAKALLAELGYGPHKRPQIVYKTSSDPFRIRLATIIQRQLGEVGIDVDLRSYDWGTFYGDIKAGRFQMFSLSWVGIKTPDIFRYVFHSESLPPSGANRGRYVDVEADRLIEQADAGADLDQQAADYRQLQARLLAQLPYVPLWYEDHVFIANNNIAGYQLARDGNYDGLNHVQRR